MNHKIILIILYVIYTVGLIGHIIEPIKEYMLLLTPITILFTGSLVLYKVLPKNYDLIRWIVITYIVTFCLEVFGVKTGLLFGPYQYGDIFGLKVFDTPILIGFNWVLVILGAVILIQKYVKNGFLVILLVPLFTVVFDFFLEPVAIRLGYWNWMTTGGYIPIQNYLAWFAISMIAAFYFVLLKIEVKSTLPIHYFGIQITFFLILSIVL